jgi:hypothetical protein
VSTHAASLHSASPAPGPCHGPPLGEPHCAPADPGPGGLGPGFAGLRTLRCSTPTRCCSRPRRPVSAPSSRSWAVRHNLTPADQFWNWPEELRRCCP